MRPLINLVMIKKSETKSENSSLSYSPWIIGTKFWGQSLGCLTRRFAVSLTTSVGTSSLVAMLRGRSRSCNCRTCSSNWSFSFCSLINSISWSKVRREVEGWSGIDVLKAIWFLTGLNARNKRPENHKRSPDQELS